MQKQPYPILEFDPEPQAILEPANVISRKNVPEHCVICFFKEVIEAVITENNAIVLTQSVSEIGQHPLYQIEVEGRRLLEALNAPSGSPIFMPRSLFGLFASSDCIKNL